MVGLRDQVALDDIWFLGWGLGESSGVRQFRDVAVPKYAVVNCADRGC